MSEIKPDNELAAELKEEVSPKKSPLKPIIIALAVILAVVLIGVWLYNTMMGYTYHARLTSANSGASSLYKSVSYSIDQLSLKGCNVKGYYLISSDRSKNINVPENIDIEALYNSINEYYSDCKKYSWFAVIEYDHAAYTASAIKWKRPIVGTYPGSGMDYLYHYGTGSAHTDKRDKATLKKLYDDAETKVRSNALDDDFLKELSSQRSDQ
ncbi:MAG: hypothetical protein IKW87_03160 [Ruminococcus sp.]|nr:hypothetical protein [Ruminococcus sp.]